MKVASGTLPAAPEETSFDSQQVCVCVCLCACVHVCQNCQCCSGSVTFTGCVQQTSYFLETDVSGKRGENHGVLPMVTMNVLLLEDILIQRTAVPVRPFVALLLSFFKEILSA